MSSSSQWENSEKFEKLTGSCKRAEKKGHIKCGVNTNSTWNTTKETRANGDRSIVLLKSSRILRTVLETWGDFLSLRFLWQNHQWYTLIGTTCKEQNSLLIYELKGPFIFIHRSRNLLLGLKNDKLPC